MRGQDVRLEAMSITYPNGFTAVQPTDLHVEAGEFFSILGPSGCGKTTILRAVSGFIAPSRGKVLIGGRDMVGKAPNARSTALIFQNLALFPLMPVWENVAFGLEARGVSKRDRRKTANELLDLVALGDQGEKMPGELSGGQRQRVAIARALAVEPAVLLLDEPLSALDLKLRQHMRAELRAIQQKTGVTFIYITHDQGEALTMSDRIAVMNKGVIEQVGTGDTIYSNPSSAFVASFVGEVNQFAGVVSEVRDDGTVCVNTQAGSLIGTNPSGLGAGARAIVFVRPEMVRLGTGLGNQLTAKVMRRDMEGPFVNFHFQTQTGTRLTMHATNTGDLTTSVDTDCNIGFDASSAIVLPESEVAKTGIEAA